MLASTIAIGITVKIRKAVVRRSKGRSGYSIENRTGCSSFMWRSFDACLDRHFTTPCLRNPAIPERAVAPQYRPGRLTGVHDRLTKPSL